MRFCKKVAYPFHIINAFSLCIELSVIFQNIPKKFSVFKDIWYHIFLYLAYHCVSFFFSRQHVKKIYCRTSTTETSIPKNIQKLKGFFSSHVLKNLCILKAMCGLCVAGNWWTPNEKSLTLIPTNGGINQYHVLGYFDMLICLR